MVQNLGSREVHLCTLSPLNFLPACLLHPLFIWPLRLPVNQSLCAYSELWVSVIFDALNPKLIPQILYYTPAILNSKTGSDLVIQFRHLPRFRVSVEEVWMEPDSPSSLTNPRLSLLLYIWIRWPIRVKGVKYGVWNAGCDLAVWVYSIWFGFWSSIFVGELEKTEEYKRMYNILGIWESRS